MELETDPPAYETGLQEVISNSWTSGGKLFNVLTPAFDSTQLNAVRLGIYLDAPLQKATPGVQWSDDGVNWGTPTSIGTFSATQGWTFETASLFTLSPKNFARFGAFVLNSTTSDAANRTGQAKLRLERRSQFGRSLNAGPQKVNTKGSTSTGAFHPLTSVVPTARFNKIRRTLVLATTSGDVKLEAAYQQTNTPDDETTWDAAVGFGSVVSSEGISFGAGFTTASLTKKWARFGVIAKNISGSDLEACLASLRVDLRYVG